MRRYFRSDIIIQALELWPTRVTQSHAHSEYANPLTVYSTEHSKLALYPGTYLQAAVPFAIYITCTIYDSYRKTKHKIRGKKN
jgi:hypothetical protein